MAKIVVTDSRRPYQIPELVKRDKLALISGVDAPLVSVIVKPL